MNLIKEQKALDIIEDIISNYLYYDRKEDEDLSVQDMNEILTEEFVEKASEKFKKELLSCVKD
jgi:hypothetical protein